MREGSALHCKIAGLTICLYLEGAVDLVDHLDCVVAIVPQLKACKGVCESVGSQTCASAVCCSVAELEPQSFLICSIAGVHNGSYFLYFQLNKVVG